MFSMLVKREEDFLMSSGVERRITSMFESRLSRCRMYRQC